MSSEWFVLVESNTTGSGRLFCTCAQQLGLRPIVLARDPDRYPYVAENAIESRAVDTSSTQLVLDACAQLGGGIAGVTSSSEYFMVTASEAARALGLPHPDPHAVRRCRDKNRQRQRLRKAGVPGPVFAAAHTPEAAVDAAGRIGLPVVVKPVAGSGSIGTRLCNRPDEVRTAASDVLDADPVTLALPPQDAVMVEQYLSGVEYSVETLDDHVVGVTRKHLGPEPYFVETGHDFPVPADSTEHLEISQTALAALRALGLGWGPAHVEVRQTVAGPRIVEVNPRLAGGMIPRMVQEACGIDMIFHVVAGAAGRGMPPRSTRTQAASIRFLVARTGGRLIEIHGEEDARRVPGVIDVVLTREPGQDVVLRHSFQDRLGLVLAAGEDGSVAARAADEGLLVLDARIAPGSFVTEGALG